MSRKWISVEDKTTPPPIRQGEYAARVDLLLNGSVSVKGHVYRIPKTFTYRWNPDEIMERERDVTHWRPRP